MVQLKWALAASLMAVTGGAANAATVDFDFTGLSGQFENNLTFTSSDGFLTLTIEAFHYADITTIGDNAALQSTAVGVGINTNGIGACEANGSGDNCKARDLLDGGSNTSTTDNEMLRFTFSGVSAPVTVNSISWNNNDTNDGLDLFAGSSLEYIKKFTAIAPPGTTDPLDGYLGGAGYDPLFVFALGVQDKSDELRIAGLSVDYDVPPAPVPLPTAGVLLLGGIGSMAALRRRRKKA